MGAWMLYALAPGVALCCAAMLAEQAARQRRWPSRWIWLVAMLGSMLLPALGPAYPELAPFHLPAPAPVSSRAAISVTAPVAVVAQAHYPALARVLWVILSIATLAVVLAGAALLRHRARDWRRTIIDGSETFVAPETGPAVFGWWRPRIVLPAWLAGIPSRQRALAVAHEQSHLDARDPQLLGAALVLLAVMPWNPSVWWQLRRLRHAIEVDCDARVLRGGHDVLDYGEALLALGLRRSRRYGLMAATDSSQSLLERRIRIMSSQPNHWSRVTAGALACLALCAAAVAAELAPAAASSPAPSASNQSADNVAPLAPRALRDVPPLPAPRAPHAPRALSAVAALPAPIAPHPPLPALAALAPPPPTPPVAAIAPAVPEDAEENSASDEVEAAKMEAVEASERAAELKNDAEEAERAAQEAMRDAQEQQAQAEEAKREAEAAANEANARKQEAEAKAAAQAAKSPSVN
jgi:beta-lactamase regulating signal transducer with metallopeptidase domain